MFHTMHMNISKKNFHIMFKLHVYELTFMPGGGGDGGWDDKGETIVQGDASKLIHMKLLDIFYEMYGNFTVTLEETKLNISDTILERLIKLCL